MGGRSGPQDLLSHTCSALGNDAQSRIPVPRRHGHVRDVSAGPHVRTALSNALPAQVLKTATVTAMMGWHNARATREPRKTLQTPTTSRWGSRLQPGRIHPRCGHPPNKIGMSGRPKMKITPAKPQSERGMPTRPPAPPPILSRPPPAEEITRSPHRPEWW